MVSESLHHLVLVHGRSLGDLVIFKFTLLCGHDELSRLLVVGELAVSLSELLLVNLQKLADLVKNGL